MFFLIEKMKGLIAQQRDVRVLSQKIVQRSSAGLLHPGHYKIYLIELFAPKERAARKFGCKTMPFRVVRFDPETIRRTPSFRKRLYYKSPPRATRKSRARRLEPADARSRVRRTGDQAFIDSVKNRPILRPKALKICPGSSLATVAIAV